MASARATRTRAGALIVALLMLSLAGAAYSAAGVQYHGTTSQHRSISFTILRKHIRMLQFRINDRCPSGHVYLVHDWGFPPIKIAHSAFDETFVSPPSQKASARVKGHASRGRVKGSLFDRRFIKSEHHYCTGSATFDLQRSQ